MTTTVLFLAIINSVSSIQWYRGNIIPGANYGAYYGAYYASTINKIIIFSDKVTLFDPYLCTFQQLNITTPYPYTALGQLIGVNDKIYINYVSGGKTKLSDRLVVFDPITYDFKLINQVTPSYGSCLISDKVNQKLYIVGGRSQKSTEYWCNLKNETQFTFRCFGEYLTQIYSITDNSSHFDANLAIERRNPSCINYHNHLYVFGGHLRVKDSLTGNLYDIQHLTIEVLDLNITNNKSKLYGWKKYDPYNLKIPELERGYVGYAPNVLIFDDYLYLFQYDAPNPSQMIQILDPVQEVIINDTSSLSFNGINFRDGLNRISSPVNVNDELIYVFGGDDANTFQFGVINDSVREKLDSKCFWPPTVTNKTTNNKFYNGTYNSGFESIFIIIIFVSLTTILVVIVGCISYMIKRKRNQRHDIVNDVEINHEMEKEDKRYNEKNCNAKKITFSEGNIAAQFEMDEFDNQIEGN